MFVSSARMKLRRPSTEESGIMDAADKNSGDILLRLHSEGGLQEEVVNDDDRANSAPFYPSVAQRISLWRNMTTEVTNQPSPSECDGVTSNINKASSPVHSPSGEGLHGHDNRFGRLDNMDSSYTDRLQSELNESRRRNKKLAITLASVERKLQQMDIDHRLQDDKMEAMVSTRVADTLSNLLNDRSSILTDAANTIHYINALSSELKDVQNGDRSKLLSLDDCRSAVASYIRDHGCQLPVSSSPSSGPYSQVQENVPSSAINKAPTRDVGTDSRNSDADETENNGNDHVTLALSNSNRELLIENAQLREQLEEAQNRTRSVEDECNQLLVQLENCKNRASASSLGGLDEENARLKEELDKQKRRYEQAEAKWEREAYETRAKFLAADEANFRLSEELKTLQRQSSASNRAAVDGNDDDDGLAAALERVKTLSDENSKLQAKNEELKRLVTVLRRKVSAATTVTTTTSTSSPK